MDMRYVAAYALATLSGNMRPTVADLRKILLSVDAPFDEMKI
jgi:ribosomal protein L12E/L44/L45/RPP1/RPP2